MGWRARSEPEPEGDGGREMMHWLLETYEAAGAHPEPAALVRVSQPREPVGPPEPVATPLRAVALLERPIELVPEDPSPAEESASAPVPEPEPVLELEPVLQLAPTPAPAPALFAERRRERRVDCALAVAAAAPSNTAEMALGEAVDVSRSGIRVVMDKVAVVGPVDLMVADVVVDARVVGYRAIGDGRHSWHIHVLDADEAWLELVQRA